MFNTDLNPLSHSPAFTGSGTPKRYSASMLRPGNHTGNHKPSCTRAQANGFAVKSRNVLYAENIAAEMAHINKIAGREPRRVRRAMARARARRIEL